MIYTRHQILFIWLDQEKRVGRGIGAYETERNVCRILVGKPKVEKPLEDLDRDAQGVLKWISKKGNVRGCGQDWRGSCKGYETSCCEHGSEHFRFHKMRGIS
jgi:hypothetical protein